MSTMFFWKKKPVKGKESTQWDKENEEEEEELMIFEEEEDED